MNNFWLNKKNKKESIWDFNIAAGDAVRLKYKHRFVKIVEITDFNKLVELLKAKHKQ